jgi:hypothetical protein
MIDVYIAIMIILEELRIIAIDAISVRENGV